MKHIVYGNGESRPTTDLIGVSGLLHGDAMQFIVILLLTILFL